MAKSPIYGLGRNWKHRPQGALRTPSAANVKMKGKKEKLMSCGCCVCINFRADVQKNIHRKEMREAA